MAATAVAVRESETARVKITKSKIGIEDREALVTIMMSNLKIGTDNNIIFPGQTIYNCSGKENILDKTEMLEIKEDNFVDLWKTENLKFINVKKDEIKVKYDNEKRNFLDNLEKEKLVQGAKEEKRRKFTKDLEMRKNDELQSLDSKLFELNNEVDKQYEFYKRMKNREGGYGLQSIKLTLYYIKFLWDYFSESYWNRQQNSRIKDKIEFIAIASILIKNANDRCSYDQRVNELAAYIFDKISEFKNNNIEYIDQNRELLKGDTEFKNMFLQDDRDDVVEPRKHQEEFLNFVVRDWDNGFFIAYTTVMGSGKTTSAIGLASLVDLKNRTRKNGEAKYKFIFSCNSYLVKLDVSNKLFKYSKLSFGTTETDGSEGYNIRNMRDNTVTKLESSPSIIIANVEYVPKILNELKQLGEEAILFFDEPTMGAEDINSEQLKLSGTVLSNLPKRTVLSSATLPIILSTNNNEIHKNFKETNGNIDMVRIGKSGINISCQLNNYNNSPHSVFYGIKSKFELDKLVKILETNYYFRRFCTFDDLYFLYTRMKALGDKSLRDKIDTIAERNLWSEQNVSERMIELLKIIPDNMVEKVCYYNYEEQKQILDIWEIISKFNSPTLIVTENPNQIKNKILEIKDKINSKFYDYIQDYHVINYNNFIPKKGDNIFESGIEDKIKVIIQQSSNEGRMRNIDELKELAKIGVAMYRDGMNKEEKEFVFRLLKANNILYLISDGSIAYGANFPIENIVILPDLGDQKSIETISQISGRAGREGLSEKANVMLSNEMLFRLTKYIQDGFDRIYNEGENMVMISKIEILKKPNQNVLKYLNDLINKNTRGNLFLEEDETKNQGVDMSVIKGMLEKKCKKKINSDLNKDVEIGKMDEEIKKMDEIILLSKKSYKNKREEFEKNKSSETEKKIKTIIGILIENIKSKINLRDAFDLCKKKLSYINSFINPGQNILLSVIKYVNSLFELNLTKIRRFIENEKKIIDEREREGERRKREEERRREEEIKGIENKIKEKEDELVLVDNDINESEKFLLKKADELLESNNDSIYKLIKKQLRDEKNQDQRLRLNERLKSKQKEQFEKLKGLDEYNMYKGAIEYKKNSEMEISEFQKRLQELTQKLENSISKQTTATVPTVASVAGVSSQVISQEEFRRASIVPPIVTREHPFKKFGDLQRSQQKQEQRQTNESRERRIAEINQRLSEINTNYDQRNLPLHIEQEKSRLEREKKHLESQHQGGNYKQKLMKYLTKLNLV